MKVKQTVVAYFDFVHVGRGPTRCANPHLAFAIAITVHQRGHIRAAKISDVGDVVGGGEILADTEALIALIGVLGQRDRAAPLSHIYR